MPPTIFWREAGTITFGDVFNVLPNDNYSQGGFYRTLQDCKLLESTATPCRDCVANYLKDTLGGKTGTAYASPQGRVTITED